MDFPPSVVNLKFPREPYRVLIISFTYCGIKKGFNQESLHVCLWRVLSDFSFLFLYFPGVDIRLILAVSQYTWWFLYCNYLGEFPRGQLDFEQDGKGYIFNYQSQFFNRHIIFILSLICSLFVICVFNEICPFYLCFQIYYNKIIHSIFLHLKMFWNL